MKRVFLLIPLTLNLAACAQLQAWEKGRLASPQMQSAGPHPLIKQMHQHVYSSKEASKGGDGVGGGGCGCN